jgi:hypothetical protein
MNEKKIWYEDIGDLDIDKDKVKNFHYPIIPGETIQFRESLVTRLVNLFKELKKNKNTYFDECTASLFTLAGEIVDIYYTLLLKKKLEQDNYKIVPAKKSRLLTNILDKKSLEYPRNLQMLIKGRGRVKKRYFLVRPVRNLLMQKYVKKSYIKPLNLETDVVSIGDNPIIENHAKYEKQKVYYVRINQWFEKLNQPSGKNSDLDSVSINILEIIFDEFNKNQIDLNENLKLYLKKMLNLLLLKLSVYKRSILDTKIGLPKILWTPSGGGIFTNIFRQVCKSNGSKVVGHAHGSGTGFFSDYGRTLSVLEYQSCTDFYVFTKKSIKEYIKYAREDLIIDGKLPNIKSIEGFTHWPSDRLTSFQKIFNIKNKKKYILYIPSLFLYDHFHDGKLVDAHHTYDWLLKLSNFFNKNNLDFKVKLHPEKKTPDEYVKYYKKNISEKNLAKSIEDSWLIITDQPSSSSFAASVVSNKPIIFIDLKVQDFSNYATTLLKKRCSIIEAKFTNEGINLNWELLIKLIKNPQKNFSQEFKNTYFEDI